MVIKKTKSEKVDDRVRCAICGELVHSIPNHLVQEHPEMTAEEYQKRFPESPLFSPTAQKRLEEIMSKRQAESEKEGVNYFHKVFELGALNKEARSAKSSRGIPITVYAKTGSESDELIPEINRGYVFNVPELKQVVMGVEMNIPIYIWGHKGAGKTELVEQICARTNRPLLRVQHTVNTEESQIVGQWTVRDGETLFEYGPLPLAMINGWAYLADEYDFAMPNVLAVYQAVLEGKPLMIKEAPASMRIVKPHPNFRFFATGNTNGTGDETGLYQGTSIQNSANYDRFGVVIRKKYLSREDEKKILLSNTGISANDADNLVEFAHSVRETFDSGEISDTISPRTLLFAAKLGVAQASLVSGLRLAFFNKLSTTDREACEQLAQRLFSEPVSEE